MSKIIEILRKAEDELDVITDWLCNEYDRLYGSGKIQEACLVSTIHDMIIDVLVVINDYIKLLKRIEELKGRSED
ncbi:MAG: hypothetical protein DRO09_04210 [Thermoprotei archaeon]|nr:MAG: hypothetical protein DRO09_04210 [Thermoprotei archaeon]